MGGDPASQASLFKAALVQMSPLHLDKKANVERMEGFDTDPWFALGPGIAASNVIWFVQVNRVGGEPSWPGFGGSQIVSPSGRVVAKGADDESIVYGEIDVAEVFKRRGETPVWFDRRPDVYSAIAGKQP